MPHIRLAYEVEMNLVIHLIGGTLSIDLDGDYMAGV